MRAGFAPRAPHWGRSTPPDPLQVVLAARLMHRLMALVCPNLYRCLPLNSAQSHPRLTFPRRPHHFGVPRGDATGGGVGGSAPDRPPRRRPESIRLRALTGATEAAQYRRSLGALQPIDRRPIAVDRQCEREGCALSLA